MTSDTSSGATAALFRTSLMTVEPRSWTGTVDKAPLKEPGREAREGGEDGAAGGRPGRWGAAPRRTGTLSPGPSHCPRFPTGRRFHASRGFEISAALRPRGQSSLTPAGAAQLPPRAELAPPAEPPCGRGAATAPPRTGSSGASRESASPRQPMGKPGARWLYPESQSEHGERRGPHRVRRRARLPARPGKGRGAGFRGSYGSRGRRGSDPSLSPPATHL